ncbi:SDR family NAD(P)-dependent oxidoreductase [Sphingomonas sp. KR1UV-12]|uniref:SDR family NAD(P)-dependent oxidoreductase n=1 Tax=Sphingomonas aurea TaxID=3063994 RepID=A0ABT9EI02_9SPHN|nr:SDR family NAD(P)-dependent oxidoreductase [Sphingomonas sp. KR1UV-12]MDP1026465.1 SDR family NAD(P)-dependent oxidoreductase [Sphingomonas sp. KR1UV-12]
MTILVTGGAGFIGANLADRLAGDGHRVRVYDALSRAGTERNLDWLRDRHGDAIDFVHADIRDADRLAQAVTDADAVFHLAAQVAVTTSMVDPREDHEINIGGTFNLLEALRQQGRAVPLVFASTNKVYGDLADLDFRLDGDAYVPVDAQVRAHGIGEDRPLDFHTPYGVSKGAADQYVLDYARSFGLPAAVIRMSCIYGQRQMGTEDQGWVAHFLIRALQGEPITLYGDGHQVRDILDVSNAVDAYVQAWRHIDAVKGRAFNLGGGPANAISLRQLIAHIGTLIGREVEVSYADWRAGDQRYFVADTRAAEQALGLAPKRAWQDGVATLARWLAAERRLNLPVVEEALLLRAAS